MGSEVFKQIEVALRERIGAVKTTQETKMSKNVHLMRVNHMDGRRIYPASDMNDMEAYAAMEKERYAHPCMPASRRFLRGKRLFREKLLELKWRIHSAWLVLRGRADIC